MSAPPIQRQHWDDGRECREAPCDRGIDGAFMRLAVKVRRIPGVDSALISPFLSSARSTGRNGFIFCIRMWYLFICSLIATTEIPATVVAQTTEPCRPGQRCCTL